MECGNTAGWFIGVGRNGGNDNQSDSSQDAEPPADSTNGRAQDSTGGSGAHRPPHSLPKAPRK